MKRTFLLLGLLSLGACTSGGYVAPAVVYAEPVEYVYVAPVDQVVVVSRQVLVSNGYTVYRVTRSGSNRVLWARRGPDEMVRLYLTPSGQTVAVNGLVEVRERHSNRGWQRRGSPNRVLAGINGKLKRHGRDRDRDH